MSKIESIQPEVAAYDLERIFREEGDATATAALTVLLHNVTGCDIPVTADTPQSDVEELVPLAVSILRRHWTTPLTALGDGTTPMSLADLLRRLIGDRVQGNEAMCIPPVHDNIPAAVSALLERKIGGVPEAPDGVSLPHLLCDSTIANTITELIDDNIGWHCDKLLKELYTAAPAKKVALNCKTLTFNNDKGWTDGCTNIEELEMPELETINFPKSVGYEQSVFSGMSIERLYIPKLKSYTSGGYGVVVANSPVKYIDLPQFTTLKCVYANRVVRNCAELLELNIPNYAGPSNSWEYRTIDNCPKIRKVVIGECNLGLVISGEHPDLIEVQIAEGYNISLPMGTWNPTTALADNLPLFLSNFRQYIADRLSDKGSGKTLTLSQEVRDAIHSAGIDTIITNKGWTISPVPTQQ